jgi:nitrous oxide reductase accessory protein NosL
MAGGSNALKSVNGQIEVPRNAKCPVCGMFVAKYPKWAARIEAESKNYYFDGVKDMMKFYIFDIDFPFERQQITTMEVTDFYTIKAIDAKDAFYVIGSDMYGPMGNELIPFSTQDAADNFMRDHRGKKIILFHEITPKLVMELDGIEYKE